MEILVDYFKEYVIISVVASEESHFTKRMIRIIMYNRLITGVSAMKMCIVLTPCKVI
jgi:hypothetical protein